MKVIQRRKCHKCGSKISYHNYDANVLLCSNCGKNIYFPKKAYEGGRVLYQDGKRPKEDRRSFIYFLDTALTQVALEGVRGNQGESIIIDEIRYVFVRRLSHRESLTSDPPGLISDRFARGGYRIVPRKVVEEGSLYRRVWSRKHKP